MAALADRLKTAAYITLAVVFFFSGYVVIYAVTTAFLMTHSGYVRWLDGWRAAREMLGV